MADLADYLDLTVSQAQEQFRRLLARRPVATGRQVTFLPVETLLCLAASFLVNHRHFGGSTAHQAPEPVPSLARLLSRPPSSVLAKMANLDGSRSHGARHDVRAGAMLRDDPPQFSRVYRVLLHAARAEGIGPGQLPDFLGLESGGELALLGQEELDISTLEAELREQIRRHPAADGLPERETERILLAAARVGQHVFAQNVLLNCGNQCVFCGLSPAAFGGRRMLLAGHIKPWKDSSPSERLDFRNGLAACPTHDVPSIRASSPSTAGCVSTSRPHWPMRPSTTHWPGSFTGAHRCAWYCCCRPTRRHLRRNISTGTSRRYSGPDRHACVRRRNGWPVVPLPGCQA